MDASIQSLMGWNLLLFERCKAHTSMKLTISRNLRGVALGNPGCIMGTKQRDLRLENDIKPHSFPLQSFNLQNQLEFKQTFLMGVSPFFFCAAISACVKCKRYCNIWLILVPQIISDISNIELIIPRGEKKNPKHPPLLPLIFPHLKEGHFPGLLH